MMSSEKQRVIGPQEMFYDPLVRIMEDNGGETHRIIIEPDKYFLLQDEIIKNKIPNSHPGSRPGCVFPMTKDGEQEVLPGILFKGCLIEMGIRDKPMTATEVKERRKRLVDPDSKTPPSNDYYGRGPSDVEPPDDD